uniref:Uncharacterized protein n=1 Tax=Cannabis sativa TaxID=3483 RepID=A0A803P9Q3_CANSA
MRLVVPLYLRDSDSLKPFRSRVCRTSSVKGDVPWSLQMGFLCCSIILNAHRRISWSIPPGKIGLACVTIGMAATVAMLAGIITSVVADGALVGLFMLCVP